MQFGEPLFPLFGLRVTRKTQFAIDGFQQGLMRRAVRAMAGEASVFTVNRCMRVRDSCARILVAAEAKLVAGFDEQGRLLGGVGVMALQTLAVLEGWVQDGFTSAEVFSVVALAA
jgi:predicted ATPase